MATSERCNYGVPDDGSSWKPSGQSVTFSLHFTSLPYCLRWTVPGVGNCSNKLSRGYTIVTAPRGEWIQWKREVARGAGNGGDDPSSRDCPPFFSTNQHRRLRLIAWPYSDQLFTRTAKGNFSYGSRKPSAPSGTYRVSLSMGVEIKTLSYDSFRNEINKNHIVVNYFLETKERRMFLCVHV